MSVRTERVGSVIIKALPKKINELASEYGAGLVTLTDVKVTKDLSIAYVYFTAIGGKISPLEFIEKLERKEIDLRLSLNSHLRLRKLPQLKFHLDDTLDKINHIEKVITDIKSDRDKKEIDFDYLNNNYKK
ncbi:MAG: 30S ribosome-binding factor RbfA [Candidatus Kapaibacteriales bacterium]